MLECIICFENKKKTLTCLNCSKSTCKKCLKYYKKYECCNCNTKFLEREIKKVFNESEIERYIYYYVYKKYFLNIKIQDIINKHFTKLENQRYLRFGFIKNNLEKPIIKRCFDKDCKGVFYDENCSLCPSRICLTCEEEYHRGDCDPTVLENLKEIKENCKKCPFCFIYINKTMGCNSMKCTNCGVSFNWRNLEIDDKKQNNEHYNTILNTNLNKFFLNHFKNNKFVREEEGETEEVPKITFPFLKNKKFIKERYRTIFLNLYKKYKQKEKNLKKYEIQYLLHVENFLKKNIESDLNDSFDTIDLKICKKLYIEDKTSDFIFFILQNLQNTFVNKEAFCINRVKNLINQYNNDNILFDKCTYTYKNDQIVLNKTTKRVLKHFVLYKKEKYINNGKITLLDDEQIEHARNVFNNLVKYGVCLNTSYAGSGKTYVSLHVARKLEVKNLIIISPNIMNSKWKELIEYYNYKNKFNYLILNFNELYTKSFEENNNLFRKFYTSHTKSLINFSDYFLEFINETTMLIIDEIHNSKSHTTTCTTFIQELAKIVSNNEGYVLGISATPIEKHTEVEHILKKVSGIKEFKNKNLNSYKISLSYKTSIGSVYDALNDKNIKTNQESESEDESENKSEEESEEECEEPVPENINPDEPSTSGLQKNKLKPTKKGGVDYISYEKKKRLEVIKEEIAFETTDMKNYFVYVFNIRLNIKIKKKIEKISDLLKNLLIVFKLTPTEIFEQIKEINELEPKNTVLYDTTLLLPNKTTKKFNDKRFEEEYKNIKDDAFKKKIETYFLKMKHKIMYVDMSTIKYREELGFRLYYIFYCEKQKHYIHSYINIFTILYLFKFNIYEQYYISTIPLDELVPILLTITLRFINYNINADQVKKISSLEHLYYLNLDLNEYDKKVLSYAFTSLDTKTDKKINNNALYFISLISKGLEQTETVYVNYIVNLVNIIYDLNKFKIVLGVSFTNTIYDLKEKFGKKKYLVINGEVKDKNKIIKQFNENDEDNLLIVNMKSLNCGVDLDDKIGNKPRLVFIIPNFSFTTLVQFIFRFKRKDTLSEPYIYIINNHRVILTKIVEKYKHIHNLKLDTPFINQIRTTNDISILNDLFD